MVKLFSFFCAMILAIAVIEIPTADASSRLKAISKGASGGEEEKEEKDYINKDDLKKKGIDTRYSGTDSSRRKNVAALRDPILIGVFETYLVTKRHNVRVTVFGEARKFLLGHRACTKIRKIRDKINNYLFSADIKADKRGRVDTEGMDAGVRKAIKQALKTKLEYFNSILVLNGRWGPHKVPKELEGEIVSDCAAVKNKYKELQKAKK